MPVRFDDVEAHADEAPRPIREGSNAHRILTLLVDHPGTGFTPSEIADRTEVSRGSVGPTLHRLAARGLVRHKEPYWAVVRDDRFATAGAMLASLEAIESADVDDGWADVDPAAYAVSDDELAAWRAAE
jgi:DNA-binding GntR family transcriptional regulator